MNLLMGYHTLFFRTDACSPQFCIVSSPQFGAATPQVLRNHMWTATLGRAVLHMDLNLEVWTLHPHLWNTCPNHAQGGLHRLPLCLFACCLQLSFLESTQWKQKERYVWAALAHCSWGPHGAEGASAWSLLLLSRVLVHRHTQPARPLTCQQAYKLFLIFSGQRYGHYDHESVCGMLSLTFGELYKAHCWVTG
jgi:hypothetical protein